MMNSSSWERNRMSDSTADGKLTIQGRPDEGESKEAKARPVMLLVDDDGATLALMATSLKLLDGRTLLAKNGEEALEILYAEPSVALVITDVGMPVMGGLELLRRIRESERLADLPVILCSGNDDRTIVQKAWEYRCARYLIKPILAEVLVDEVAEVLSRLT
jgi:two-component response regulator (ARR-A family)